MTAIIAVPKPDRITQALFTQRLYKATLRGAIYVAILNFFDFLITTIAIAHGAVEANPVARVLMDWNLIWPLKAILCVTTLMSVIIKKPGTIFTTGLVWFVAGVYSCVILVNTITSLRYIIG